MSEMVAASTSDMSEMMSEIGTTISSCYLVQKNFLVLEIGRDCRQEITANSMVPLPGQCGVWVERYAFFKNCKHRSSFFSFRM